MKTKNLIEVALLSAITFSGASNAVEYNWRQRIGQPITDKYNVSYKVANQIKADSAGKMTFLTTETSVVSNYFQKEVTKDFSIQTDVSAGAKFSVDFLDSASVSLDVKTAFSEHIYNVVKSNSQFKSENKKIITVDLKKGEEFIDGYVTYSLFGAQTQTYLSGRENIYKPNGQIKDNIEQNVKMSIEMDYEPIYRQMCQAINQTATPVTIDINGGWDAVKRGTADCISPDSFIKYANAILNGTNGTLDVGQWTTIRKYTQLALVDYNAGKKRSALNNYLTAWSQTGGWAHNSNQFQFLHNLANDFKSKLR